MSRYSILQTSLKKPGAEAVRRAFTRVPFLTPADASIILNDAFGILFRNLSYEDAMAVHEALAAEGVAVDVVENRHLPVLPATKFVKRIELRPAELIIYDPLGRKFGLEWGHVALVSAGLVPMEEEKVSTRVNRTVYRGHWGWGNRLPGNWYDADDLPLSASAMSFDEPLAMESTRRTVTVEKRMIDLILTRGVARYTLEGDETLLSHVLGRPCSRELPNAFLELIQKFSAHAPHAGLNRGALASRDQGSLMAYPSRNAFQEETQWHLWRLFGRPEEQVPTG